jgi:predicted PurR-regulated permease PerM
MMELGMSRSRVAWWGMAAVLFVVVLFVVYSFVGTFVFGLFIYYATRKLHGVIERYVSQQSVAAGLTLLLGALPPIALLVYTVAIALAELRKLERVDLGPFTSVVQPYLDVSAAVSDPSSLFTSGGVDAIRSALTEALGYLGLVGNGLLHLFVMFALAFYLLRDDDKLARWALQYGDTGGVMEEYGRAVDNSLENIFFGNILNALMTGTIGAITFSLLNVFAPPGLAIPQPALTGLLAGAASLIPIVGMKLVYVPVTGYLGMQAFLQSSGWPFVVAFFLVSLVVVDTIPDLVIRPFVSRGDPFSRGEGGLLSFLGEDTDQSAETNELSAGNLHLGMLMFAYVLGPLMFGWWGIFFAPLLLVLVVHFVRIVLPELRAGIPVGPERRDPQSLITDDESEGSPATDRADVAPADETQTESPSAATGPSPGDGTVSTDDGTDRD